MKPQVFQTMLHASGKILGLFVIILGENPAIQIFIKIGNCNSKFIKFKTNKFKDFKSALFFK